MLRNSLENSVLVPLTTSVSMSIQFLMDLHARHIWNYVKTNAVFSFTRY